MSTATAPARQSKQELITQAINKDIAGNLQISREAGGMAVQSMAEVMELAKLMAVSEQAVPPHCRNAVGICLGLAIQAIEWRMSPYAVASKSYIVNDRISYESQLIHAVIEQRAPIISRLRHSFSGAAGKRTCKVWATAKGEAEPLEYTSPEFDKITPKNSPLWKVKPDLQLFYNASRDWARMYFPDVIMGVYAEDELETITAHPPARQTGGMAGLKDSLALGGPDETAAVEGEHDGIDEPPGDDVDQTGPVDDGNQADPQALTAEEQREFELEKQSRKK